MSPEIMVIACFFMGLSLSGGIAEGGPCSNAAEEAFQACRYEALGEYRLALGKCENLNSEEERIACRSEARQALEDAQEECSDQLDAREDACDELGEGRYDPVINPANFVRRITNPFFPLVPGTTFVYQGNTEDGRERIEVEVTHETKRILGVVCIVVRDTASVDGEVVEDTLDYFAQDRFGNVWYFGEHTEEIEDGLPVSLEGAWQAGVDGAKPGIIMKANPQVGNVYRQEFLLGEAEDMAKVAALNRGVRVPFGSFGGCLKTMDFTALEPDVLESKFYAPGVGLVLEIDRETGARTELIEVIKE